MNRGQRSSSLHYAACFGRPAVAKVSLSPGKNVAVTLSEIPFACRKKKKCFHLNDILE